MVVETTAAWTAEQCLAHLAEHLSVACPDAYHWTQAECKGSGVLWPFREPCDCGWCDAIEGHNSGCSVCQGRGWVPRAAGLRLAVLRAACTALNVAPGAAAPSQRP